ncbi:hypothetical protein [Streptomyces sp. NPDC053079]|uniref:hypothetical protein n=1 Tax=Streptomyces sp. NPDC053079 TaxID=3365697 RepID=UPI0037CF5E0E
MTAHPQENNCECHWGSAEELALLKTPDVELDPDLLQRTWSAIDWRDHPRVLRRILPQFAADLVHGRVDPVFGMEAVGRCFALGAWQQWPAGQSGAVEEFLHAWWASTLTDPAPLAPAHEVLMAVSEASATVTPWLRVWQALPVPHPVADRHLTELVDTWEYDLLGDALPWSAWENRDAMRDELTAWLVHHAPARLRADGASSDLQERIRLIGLPEPARWEDPFWSRRPGTAGVYWPPGGTSGE